MKKPKFEFSLFCVLFIFRATFKDSFDYTAGGVKFHAAATQVSSYFIIVQFTFSFPGGSAIFIFLFLETILYLGESSFP